MEDFLLTTVQISGERENSLLNRKMIFRILGILLTMEAMLFLVCMGVSLGKILAYSGLMENKEVTWMPAYGPEQRGGTANVTVIISDERISSPILSKYDTAIILNQPSLAKFESKVKPGGVLIYDGYGIINPPTRKDIRVFRIDAMDEANERKMAKTFNMIVLGGLLKIRPVVSVESVVKALYKTLPERHHHLIPMNEEAVKIGMDIIREVEK